MAPDAFATEVKIPKPWPACNAILYRPTGFPQFPNYKRASCLLSNDINVTHYWYPKPAARDWRQFVVPCFAWGYPRTSMSQITAILDRAAEGEAQAAHELLPLVYEELRKLAAARMANEGDTSTLQPTALVHEAWLRLVGSEQPNWKDRGHFFAAAAEAMRRILIDRARCKLALKRGARVKCLDLDLVDVAIQADEDSLLAMNDALEKLVIEDPQSAELVKLRFFVGLNYKEAAQALGVSERSAKRRWEFARAWLYRELSSAPPA